MCGFGWLVPPIPWSLIVRVGVDLQHCPDVTARWRSIACKELCHIPHRAAAGERAIGERRAAIGRRLMNGASKMHYRKKFVVELHEGPVSENRSLLHW